MLSDALRAYCAANPGLEVRDALKYLHQSFFGCAHLVEDFDRALTWVEEEAASAGNDALPTVEALAGDYSRLHLKVLGDGLSPETLTKLFVISAEPPAPGAYEALESALCTLVSLAGSGLVPFGKGEVSRAVAEWRAAGFPACRHSEAFRARYCPAYRVVRSKFVKLLPLLCRIDRLLRDAPADRPVTVAMDGRCASGKTTLAALLERVYDCTVFHMDDFFLRPGQRTEARLKTPGGNVDYERFRSEVLLPLSAGKTVQYIRYDCQSRTLLPAAAVTPGRLVLTEGSYSLHPELAAFYDLKVMLTVSPAEQMRRIRERNSPETAARFESVWIPLEERYFEACRVREMADLILDNE